MRRHGVFGLAAVVLLAAVGCDKPQDSDGDGFLAGQGDCDDTNATIFPDARETPYDGIDQDCNGRDLLDADGDGHNGEPANGDDCDDTNPAVHPGAEEVLGDDIDQDCDGEDLKDADGDGIAPPDDCDDTRADVFPGRPAAPTDDPAVDHDCDGDADEDGSLPPTDCDDADAGINPAAEEIAYDGIDQDCAEGDLVDVDRDGYDADEAGGDDCVDTDAAFNPGRSDVPYDGDDQDCDGEDEVDVDNDGHDAARVGGDDCDDNNVVVFPGAPEVAYDGIDQDCDGFDLIDPDGDGRCQVGVTPTAALDALCPAGYGDCDDLDPRTYPGAVDWLDGKDNDCSPATTDGVVPAAAAEASLAGEAPRQSLATWMAVGDLDGDGASDLVTGAAGAPGDPAQPAEIAIWLGPTEAWYQQGVPPDVRLVGDPNTGIGLTGLVADLDDDGRDELVLGAPAAGDLEQGRVYVLFGRPDGRRTDAGLAVEAAADVTLLAPGPGMRMGTSLASADFDGDGIADLLVGAPGGELAEGLEQPNGTVFLVYGAAPGTDAAWPRGASVLPDDLNSARCHGAVPNAWFGASVAAGDLDGDGRADLIAVAARPSETVPSGPGQTRQLKPAAAYVWLSGGQEEVQLCGGNTRVESGSDLGLRRIEGRTVLVEGVPAGLALLGARVLHDDGADPDGIRSQDLLALVSATSADIGSADDVGTDLYLFNGGDPAVISWPVALVGAPMDNVTILTSSGRPMGLGHTNDAPALSAWTPLRVSLTMGDLDGDGDGDLVVGAPNSGEEGGEDVGETRVYRGQGAGRWPASLDPAAADAVFVGAGRLAFTGDAVLAADLDDDGADDLLLASPGASGEGGASGAGSISLYWGRSP